MASMGMGFFGERALAFVGEERRAQPLNQSLDQIGSQSFVFLERGLRRGFFSIQSCLFRGEDVLLVQNYCFPQRHYPARGLTLLSRSFGVIEFYEESQAGDFSREVRLLAFPQDLRELLEKEPSDMNLQDLNRLLEKMTRNDLPACWSSDFGGFERGGCYREDEQAHQEWLEEAIALLSQIHLWPKPPEERRLSPPFKQKD